MKMLPRIPSFPTLQRMMTVSCDILVVPWPKFMLVNAAPNLSPTA
jgi:hypothetical protein